MANEISIQAVSGIAMQVQLYSGAVAVGSPFSATEIGLTGMYISDMPSVAYGRYLVQAFSGDAVIASGEILWDGNYEVIDGLAKMARLDPNNPLLVTPDTMDVGDIHIGITGDAETAVTFTRS